MGAARRRQISSAPTIASAVTGEIIWQAPEPHAGTAAAVDNNPEPVTFALNSASCTTG